MVPKISILTATIASMLLMLALFVTAALAAGPLPAQAPAGKDGKGRPAAGLCFLHRL